MVEEGKKVVFPDGNDTPGRCIATPSEVPEWRKRYLRQQQRTNSTYRLITEAHTLLPRSS
ncbi:hypothetical protein ZHAS_00017459 [Anopheles sinensis]|uniref:Uncharacterized protein n=1 Tax=Anopheles sinensis TaxID=74873 RepID=A0A084WGL8_ANOSI|nr:hypothetical protein ZHAS_00017459 [Anopheles sinensis]